jgi:Multicopper oxidase
MIHLPKMRLVATRNGDSCELAFRRMVLRGLIASVGLSVLPQGVFAANDEIAKRFEFLSKNGNSGCSQAFRDSIPSLLDKARLQGSCCAPMDLHRYREQIAGLKSYAGIKEIPPDPYDIEAALAKRLLPAYGIELEPGQQKAYDEAMALSSEKGPCCCQCWRWHVYGAAWAINGTSMMGDGHAGMAPLLTLKRGGSHVLVLRNETAWWHPMHLHGHSFKLLSRNGRPIPHNQWSDTVLLAPKDVVECAFVADNPGDWMLHCHVTDHQMTGLMTVLHVA